MPHIDTLKTSKQFSYVKKKGYAARTSNLIIQAADLSPSFPNIDCHSYFYGFIITRKIGNAVTRNRLKRRLRPILKNLLPQYGTKGYGYVVVIRKSAINLSHNKLCLDLKTCIKNISNP